MYLLVGNKHEKRTVTFGCVFSLVQNAEDGCKFVPTLVAKPFKRTDLFNGHMKNVLLTSLLVTTIGSVTVAHIGTDNGRLLQVLTRKTKTLTH